VCLKTVQEYSQLYEMETLELWKKCYAKQQLCLQLNYHINTSKTEEEKRSLEKELQKELLDLDTNANSEGNIWEKLKFGHLCIIKYRIFQDKEELRKACNIAWDISHVNDDVKEEYSDLFPMLKLQIYREIVRNDDMEWNQWVTENNVTNKEFLESILRDFGELWKQPNTPQLHYGPIELQNAYEEVLNNYVESNNTPLEDAFKSQESFVQDVENALERDSILVSDKPKAYSDLVRCYESMQRLLDEINNNCNDQNYQEKIEENSNNDSKDQCQEKTVKNNIKDRKDQYQEKIEYYMELLDQCQLDSFDSSSISQESSDEDEADNVISITVENHPINKFRFQFDIKLIFFPLQRFCGKCSW
jgi:hypothetical protein